MQPPEPADPIDSGTKRSLTLFDCVCIIVGTIIGAGIFKTPSLIAAQVPNESWLIAMWVIAGLIALVGAMCFAELTTTYRDLGGDYGYLKRTFGRRFGFAFSWTAFWVIRPANISAMAIVFGQYAVDAFSASISPMSYSLGALGVISTVNLCGLRAGKWSQNLLTVAKVLGILLIFGSALFLSAQPDSSNSKTPRAASPVSAASGETSSADLSENVGANLGGATSVADEEPGGAGELAADTSGNDASKEVSFHQWFWLALVFAMFAYGGWNDIAFVACEVQQPRTNLFRSLMLGTGGVMLIYLIFNLILLNGLGLERLGALNSTEAPTEFVASRMGEIGKRLLASLVCISCVGAMSAMIFTSPRIYWATVVDYPALTWLAGSKIQHGWWRSMLMQTIVTAIFFLGFGQYENCFDLILIASAPYFWGFLAMTVVAMVVLRFRFRNRSPGSVSSSEGKADSIEPTNRTMNYNPDGFRVPLFPWLPALFTTACLFMTYQSFMYMFNSGFGLQAGCIGVWILIGAIFSWILDRKVTT